MSKMATIMMFIPSMLIVKPLSLAVMTLLVSILIATKMYSITMSSWIMFVTVLVFSSGMMTLLMYVTALVPNDTIKKTKVTSVLVTILLVSSNMDAESKTSMKEAMKMFSNQKTLILLTTVLIISIMGISMKGHHPNQPLNSSF